MRPVFMWVRTFFMRFLRLVVARKRAPYSQLLQVIILFLNLRSSDYCSCLRLIEGEDWKISKHVTIKIVFWWFYEASESVIKCLRLASTAFDSCGRFIGKLWVWSRVYETYYRFDKLAVLPVKTVSVITDSSQILANKDLLWFIFLKNYQKILVNLLHSSQRNIKLNKIDKCSISGKLWF